MKILVFGIHPDDVELGCGGSVAKCNRQGHEVTILDLSRGESSSNGTPEERALEAEEASRILGCGGRKNLGLPDGGISVGDAAGRKKIVGAIRTLRPELVLLPSRDDPHPDHSAGAVLIEEALYLAGIHGFKTGTGDESQAWVVEQGLIYPGRRDLDADVIVDVSDTFEIKMDSIRAHRTQFDRGEESKETPLNQTDFLSAVEARCRLAGHLIGVRYGEPFKTMKKISLENFSTLVKNT
jgi:bacillithiol biosynthesis deacetylase BshB1